MGWSQRLECAHGTKARVTPTPGWKIAGYRGLLQLGSGGQVTQRPGFRQSTTLRLKAKNMFAQPDPSPFQGKLKRRLLKQ